MKLILIGLGLIITVAINHTVIIQQLCWNNVIDDSTAENAIQATSEIFKAFK